jgi:DNA-binding MarR family transcriptional regulator
MKKTELARRHELTSERRKLVGHTALADFQFRLRHFLSFSEANTRKNGLTSQQYQALLTIRGLSESESSMSVNELASFLLINSRAAAGLVTRMARTGLLTRFTDPMDSRRVLVGLTRKGKRKLANVAEANWRKLHSAGSR